eukprot:CAMPEP_0182435160 /NCGR_PEP_ID=MMETSP1167-20130531/74058_1 /TAXON_ID=2988 /ORGANISM="Mallomonas Sp, Strain CCMP3275" /LENGTH=376 /DNA_ID=CAMNT_0024625885 /DNA_START=348 /DNA_END=1478 /DNA_ORIENTATION=-
MIGSGVLNQPQVFYHAGIFGAVTSFTISSLFTWLGMSILIETGLFHKKFDYSLLASHIYGAEGQLFVNLAILVNTFGALLSYLIVIGGTTALLVESWGCLQCNLYGITVLMVVVFVLPLCLYKHYGHLGLVSVLSIVAIVAVILLVIIGGPFYTVSGSVELFSPLGVLTKMGSVVFALACCPAAFHAFNSMKEQTLEAWKSVAFWSTFFGSTMCLVMGFGGYMAFKDTTSGEILENFTARYADFFKALMVLHLCLYIPIDFVVLRHSLVQIVGEESGNLPQGKHIAVTISLLGATTGIVLLIRYIGLGQGKAFGVILDFTGGMAGAFTSFVMPALMFLRHAKRDHRLYWPSVLMAVFGVFTMISVPIITVLDVAKA